MGYLLLTVIIILALDMVVSAAEAAIFSVPLNRVKQLAEKSASARVLLELKESMDGPIVTLISLSNIITIMGSVISGVVAAQVLGDAWVGIFAAVLTFLIMVFGEILPKRIGERFAQPLALVLARPVRAIEKIFHPITWFIMHVTAPFAKRTAPATSKEEIVFLTDLGKREGVINEYESRIINSVFRMTDVTAGDMMTPRPFVFFLNGRDTVGKAQDQIKTSTHSRIPVFEDVKGNIIGVAHQRDLLRALAEDKHGSLVKEYIQKPLIVPESRLGDDLIKDFLQSRKHLALVVSDYGDMIGVLGLEDVLEELVGEILDEKDVAPEFIKRASKNEIIAHGQTHIPDINRFFNVHIKSKKTLNGFILSKLGHLPAAGESFDFENLTLRMEEVSSSSIEKVRIIRREGQEMALESQKPDLGGKKS